MTWLFAALWKLPESNSLTTTAEAQECVYGNVGGPKRPRSKLSLSRMYRSVLRTRYSFARLLPKRHTGRCIRNCGPNDHSFRKRLGLRVARIPRAGECPDRQSPQVAIEAIDPT